jgi:uroporphyrinogen III methyltransferase/synthase
MRRRGCDVRALAGLRFAAIGRATEAAIEARGIIVDLVPEHFSGADLGRALVAAMRGEERVLLPRSSIGSEEICAILDAAGIAYMDIPLYDTVAERWESAALRESLVEDLDIIAFTSRSTVENFAAIFGREAMRGRRALCIGEQTERAAAAHGMETLLAENATVAAMVEAMVAAPSFFIKP